MRRSREPFPDTCRSRVTGFADIPGGPRRSGSHRLGERNAHTRRAAREYGGGVALITSSRPGPSLATDAVGQDGFGVGLLGQFRVWTAAGPMPVETAGSQRLLALLALRERAMSRKAVAGLLWPDVSEARAHGSLRSALARLHGPARRAVLTTSVDIELADWVAVDLRSARALAHRLLAPATRRAAAETDGRAIAALSLDMLPDWYDDWVMVEMEEWRQLRLHALEGLAAYLVAEGRFGDAAGAALAAIRAEPLRESAHGALIRVHLAEGNQSEALTAYDRYCALLRTELDLEPTSRLTVLVGRMRTP